MLVSALGIALASLVFGLTLLTLWTALSVRAILVKAALC